MPVDDLPEEDASKQEPEKIDSSPHVQEDSETGPSQSEVGPPLEALAEEQWTTRCGDLVARLSEGSVQQNYQAALEIRYLAKSNAKARTLFGEGGAIPALVELLSTAVDSVDRCAQENVIFALLNVAISDDK